MADQPTKGGLVRRAVEAVRYTISGIAPNTWMSPMQPLAPMAQDVKGRQFDYSVGYNLRYVPRSDEELSFAKLRALAVNCDIIRILIERQKDLLCALEWQINPREEKSGKRPKQNKYQDKIDEVTAFFEFPDQRHDWPQWLRMVLDDLLVIDAPAIYKCRNRDGSLYALEPLDGASIKVYIDATGRVPAPPSPAFAQILKGLPAVDFSSDELIYYPLNPRTNHVYGYSPVEQIRVTVETAIERLKSQHAYFTHGNMPDGIFTGAPELTTDQIKDWQSWWNGMFSGNLVNRRYGTWTPHGVTWQPIKQPPLKDDFDEWIARVACFAFSTSAQPFIKMMSRASAQTAQEEAQDAGIAPRMAWVKRFMDRIIAKDFGYPELEFEWNEDREFDPLKAAQIEDLQTKSGIKSINEVRDRLGLDPVAGGDQPMVLTPQGYVSLEPQQPLDQPGGASAQNPVQPGQAAQSKQQDPPVDDAAVRQQKKKISDREADPARGGGKPAVKKALRKDVPLDSDQSDIGPDRPDLDKAHDELTDRIKEVFEALGPSILQDILNALTKVRITAMDADTARSIADQIVDQLDLSDIQSLVEPTQDVLEEVGRSTGTNALAKVGVGDDANSISRVNQRAVDYARDRAAEMVGMKRLETGQLVPNPDARFAITDSTRDILRTVIADGLQDNIGRDAIIDQMKDTFGFSPERAELIAKTEIANANSNAALASYRAARSVGVKLKKRWLVDGNPCPICLMNAAAGPIALDLPFPSGDMTPGAHPACRCALVPVVNPNSP